MGPETFQAGLELYEVAGPAGLYLLKLKVGHWLVQVITWANVDLVPCHRLVSPGYNELLDMYYHWDICHLNFTQRSGGEFIREYQCILNINVCISCHENVFENYLKNISSQNPFSSCVDQSIIMRLMARHEVEGKPLCNQITLLSMHMYMQLIVLAALVPWINHLPPVCCSTF